MTPEVADVMPNGDRGLERASRSLPPLRLTPHPAHSRSGTIVDRALRAAAARLSSEGSVLPVADLPHATAFDELCNAVAHWTPVETPDIKDFPSGVATRRLLTTLRSAFLLELDRMSTRLRAGEVIHVMRAFDGIALALEDDLDKGTEPTPTSVDSQDPGVVVEVAHDMRSPLSSILFLVETLRRGQSGTLNRVQERQLGLVYSAALGLSSLASDLIELAREGDRLLEGGPTPFSVREIFGGVRDIVLPIAEEKGLTLRVDPPESDWRMGSPAALHRVLLNLTTNALKFTNEGSVEVGARQLPLSRVEFAVTDTGRGIPADVLPTLCNAFRPRTPGGRESFSSVGLGLAICRKLVRKMGGELRAETTPGVGSRLFFTLDLPVSRRL